MSKNDVKLYLAILDIDHRNNYPEAVEIVSQNCGGDMHSIFPKVFLVRTDRRPMLITSELYRLVGSEDTVMFAEVSESLSGLIRKGTVAEFLAKRSD